MRRQPRRAYVLCVIATLAASFAGTGQETPLGDVFQVNSYTTESQYDPQVAVEDDGDFVVVWESPYDGADNGIFAQRFSSTGAALGGEFQVNERTVGQQFLASVAADADGDFFVVWSDVNNADGASQAVFGRFFTSAGAPVAGELQVNTFTPNAQTRPAAAALPNGDFVVAWSHYGQDDDQSGSVFSRRFSSAGTPLASEFRVNTYTPSGQRYASVAAGGDGSFVVVWQSYTQDSGLDDWGVFAQRFSSLGDPAGDELHVNSHTVGSQGNPAVAVEDGGAFVVVWQSYEQDGDEYGIFAQRFSSAGEALGGELQVNLSTMGGQYLPAVAADPNGGFVVAWHGPSPGGGANDIFLRRYSSSGAAVGGELQINTYTPGYGGGASIAFDDSGRFVVAWSSYPGDGDSNGIFAQRFGALESGIPLDVDGNGQTLALTDGLLVLRRFFGLDGTALTAGAIGANCSRCDAAAIEPYIAGLGLALDVDGNGQTQALSDGLLVLRYLFGLTGSTLVQGAVAGNCTRCDETTIGPYLVGLDG